MECRAMNKEGTVHNPPDGIQQVITWYQRAQVDYIELFLKMYIAYNAWYQEVTATTNDRQALGIMKKRFVIWDDYRNGRVMRTLVPYMERLVDLTQKEPLSTAGLLWNGRVENIYDWRSLIEYWYQVRCLIAHGAVIRPKYAWLAYETLDVFMAEIIQRVQACLESHRTDADPEYAELHSLSLTSRPTERFEHLQNKLYRKYIAAPNVWQVDMQRVAD